MYSGRKGGFRKCSSVCKSVASSSVRSPIHKLTKLAPNVYFGQHLYTRNDFEKSIPIAENASGRPYQILIFSKQNAPKTSIIL